MSRSNTNSIYISTCKEIPFLLLLLEVIFKHYDQTTKVSTFSVYSKPVRTKSKYFATNICYCWRGKILWVEEKVYFRTQDTHW